MAFATVGALLLLSAAAASEQHAPLDLSLGVVRYSDSVADIWKGMSDYFESEHDIALRVELYDTYEALVGDLIVGAVDIAWNGPIAHMNATVLAEKRGGLVSLGMRDVDRDMRSVVVARRGWLAAHGLLPASRKASLTISEHLESMRSAIEEAGRSGRIAAGASDSPQSFVIPFFYLVSKFGLQLSRSDVTTFDIDIGKHGDTAVGELHALDSLASGSSDVAMVSLAMLERYLADGDKASASGDNEFVVVEDKIVLDHCRFDALRSKVSDEAQKRFTSALLAMDMANEQHAPIMKAEGIASAWLEARLSRDKEMLVAMLKAGLSVPQHAQADHDEL